MDALREGISAYKAIRGQLKAMTPFFPLGFGRVNDARLAYGVRGGKKAFLSVFGIREKEIGIPLQSLGGVKQVSALYPAGGDCEYRLEGDTLKVTLPTTPCARVFELEL